MTTKDIYGLAVRMGALSDLRGLDRVKKYLNRIRKQYEALPEAEQVEFDAERLVNPYSDTRVLVDNAKGEIRKVLAGIDLKTPELLLADRLGDIDLAITHHPEGVALASLDEVMSLQAEIFSKYGVPINIAEGVLKSRIAEVSRSVAPANHNRSVDSAKLLGLDYMCTHTIADNLGARYLYNLLEDNKEKLETVGDVVNLLKTVSEYKIAIKHNAGPKITVGHKDNSCGRVAITEFTGGTDGGKDVYEKLAQSGVGTIISMHQKEEARSEAKKYHINVIIAGHMASDSLGMNLFLDELEKQGIEVIATSGLIRHRRF